MKRKTRLPKIKYWLLFGLVVLLLVLLARNLYQQLYSHRTLVLADSVRYEREIPFRAAVLYDQETFEADGVQIDPDRTGRRVGAHETIGTASAFLWDRILPVGSQEMLFAWIRDKEFRNFTQPLAPVPIETAGETTEEDPFASTLPDTFLHLEEDRLVLNRSAYVSPQTDGYEKILAYDTGPALRAEALLALFALPEAKPAQNRFSLINDHRYAIAAVIEKEDAPEDISNLTLRVGDKEYHGSWEHTDTGATHTLMLVTMEEGFQDLYPARFIEGNVLSASFEALELPQEALIEKEGQTGVYIKNDDAVVEFVPTDPVYREDERIYVPLHDSLLSMYDEVFVHPKGVTEGEFIE